MLVHESFVIAFDCNRTRENRAFFIEVWNNFYHADCFNMFSHRLNPSSVVILRFSCVIISAGSIFESMDEILNYNHSRECHWIVIFVPFYLLWRTRWFYAFKCVNQVLKWAIRMKAAAQFTFPWCCLAFRFSSVKVKAHVANF